MRRPERTPSQKVLEAVIAEVHRPPKCVVVEIIGEVMVFLMDGEQVRVTVAPNDGVRR